MRRKALVKGLALLILLFLMSAAVWGSDGSADAGDTAGETVEAVTSGGTAESSSEAAASSSGNTAESGNATESGNAAESGNSAESGNAAESGDAEKSWPGIMILYTSDIHCGVNKGFGFAGLQQIRDTLEKQGYEVLLVDDGDAVQGELIGTVSKGEKIVELMNDLGYDFAIPGNHEFDFGMDQFMKFTEIADFPYLSCNFNREGTLVLKPYAIKEVRGIKIAFVGVTTPRTLTSSHPMYFKDENGKMIYGFMEAQTGEKLQRSVQDAVDSARAEGADLVYVIAHLGNKEKDRPWNYTDLIANTSGIDVLLDGHSHDSDQVVMKNKEGKDVVRSAVGTKLSSIGYSHISAEGKILETDIWSWPEKISLPELLGIENETGLKVAASVEEVEKSLEKPIGEAQAELTIFDPRAKGNNGNPLRIIRSAETNLGDLIADAFRAKAGSDIGLVNGGGIRSSIGPGVVTLKDLLLVFPFDNRGCIIEATGQQILDALEWGCHAIPGEFGGMLHVSGITYEVHTYIDSTCTEDESRMFTGVTGERRVKNVKVGGVPLDPEKTYTICANDYPLIHNGDGHTAFDGAAVIDENLGQDAEILMQYITDDLGGIIGEKYADPYGEGRIVIVEQPSDSPAQEP